MSKTPTILLLLDGYSGADQSAGGPVSDGKTPWLEKFRREFACTVLSVSGADVGLMEGTDSKAGHVNAGAGRIVPQEEKRVALAVENGSFFQNAALVRAMENCREKDSALHLLGGLSGGELAHCAALLRMAKEAGVERVFLHLFLEKGTPAARDGLLRKAIAIRESLGAGQIASLMGSRYACGGRDRLDLVEMAYDALVYGGSALFEPDPLIAAGRPDGVGDEWMEPVLCQRDGVIGDHDSVIFFSFQPERIRELAAALADPDFNGFTRQIFPLCCVCYTDCGAAGTQAAFPRLEVPNALGEYLSGLGLKQLRIAESERFPHVTFFFNGWRAEPFPGEDRLEIPSPNVPSYDLQPEMSAFEVCERCLERMESGEYDLIVLNFPNCAAVPRSGDGAAARALETVDACTGKIVKAALQMGGIAMITSCCTVSGGTVPDSGAGAVPSGAADGGKVPFILCGAGSKLRPGRLADIAPTLLDVMGLACPAEMDGKTLIVE